MPDYLICGGLWRTFSNVEIEIINTGYLHIPVVHGVLGIHFVQVVGGKLNIPFTGLFS